MVTLFGRPYEQMNWRFLVCKQTIVISSLATLSIAPALYAQDKAVDSRLEGTWQIERVEGNDDWSEESHKPRLTFRGSKLTFSDDEADEPTEFNVRTNPAKSPPHMDWSCTINREREKHDVSLPSIYAIDKLGQLKICLTKHEPFALCRIIDEEGNYGPRPSSFSEKQTICIIAVRVKPKEKK